MVVYQCRIPYSSSGRVDCVILYPPLIRRPCISLQYRLTKSYPPPPLHSLSAFLLSYRIQNATPLHSPSPFSICSFVSPHYRPTKQSYSSLLNTRVGSHLFRKNTRPMYRKKRRVRLGCSAAILIVCLWSWIIERFRFRFLAFRGLREDRYGKGGVVRWAYLSSSPGCVYFCCLFMEGETRRALDSGRWKC